MRAKIAVAGVVVVAFLLMGCLVRYHEVESSTEETYSYEEFPAESPISVEEDEMMVDPEKDPSLWPDAPVLNLTPSYLTTEEIRVIVEPVYMRVENGEVGDDESFDNEPLAVAYIWDADPDVCPNCYAKMEDFFQTFLHSSPLKKTPFVLSTDSPCDKSLDVVVDVLHSMSIQQGDWEKISENLDLYFPCNAGLNYKEEIPILPMLAILHKDMGYEEDIAFMGFGPIVSWQPVADYLAEHQK